MGKKVVKSKVHADMVAKKWLRWYVNDNNFNNDNSGELYVSTQGMTNLKNHALRL